MRNVGRGYKISNFFFYLKWRKFAYIRCCETLASCFDPFFFLVIFFQVRRSSSQARKCVCPSSQLKQKKERFFFGRRRRGNCPISPPTNFKNPFSLSLWLLLQWTTAIGLWRVSGGPFSSSSSFSPFLSLRRFFSSLSLGRLHQGGGAAGEKPPPTSRTQRAFPPPQKKSLSPSCSRRRDSFCKEEEEQLNFLGIFVREKMLFLKVFGFVCFGTDCIFITVRCKESFRAPERERKKLLASPIAEMRFDWQLLISPFPRSSFVGGRRRSLNFFSLSGVFPSKKICTSFRLNHHLPIIPFSLNWALFQLPKNSLRVNNYWENLLTADTPLLFWRGGFLAMRWFGRGERRSDLNFMTNSLQAIRKGGRKEKKSNFWTSLLC